MISTWFFFRIQSSKIRIQIISKMLVKNPLQTFYFHLVFSDLKLHRIDKEIIASSKINVLLLKHLVQGSDVAWK